MLLACESRDGASFAVSIQPGLEGHVAWAGQERRGTFVHHELYKILELDFGDGVLRLEDRALSAGATTAAKIYFEDRILNLTCRSRGAF